MTDKDVSRAYSELESDDYSMETSVPTDLTLSLADHSDDQQGGRNRRDRKSKITKQLIERKQLLHDLQLCKIELSQKALIVDNQKAEHLQKCEELEERLNDALHQKQILQARLESQLQIQQDEAKRRQDLIRKELEEVTARQHQLDATNLRLKEKTGDVRKSLKDLALTESRYYELKSMKDDEVSLRDYVALRLYEVVRPLTTEGEQLRIQNKTLETEFTSTSRELLNLHEKLDEERQAHGDIRVRYQKLIVVFAETKGQLKQDNYRVENYEKVKTDRDNFEHDNLDVQRQLMLLEASHNSVLKERDELQRDVSSSKQSIALLRQDKDYLNRQVTDLTHRTAFCEEKLQQVNMQLDDAKKAREEMYEKYVESRDQYKSEYDSKLREELEQIRIRTNAEIDRLRTSTKEMYERENRNLREARDMAFSEKERSQATERETSTKYESLLTEFRNLQMNGDNRLCETQNELKIKAFELERSQMLHEETVRNVKETQLQCEKQEKKLEVLTKEYYLLQTSSEKRNSEHESQISEQKMKLETYEKLEQELDNVIMQAAEVEGEEDAEKVLFSYGYGANIPTTSKRRLKQSVHLAKRVLQLERTNTTLHRDVSKEQEKVKQLAEELRQSNCILDQAQQPYNYLIDSMRQRDEQLKKQRELIDAMDNDLRKVTQEKKELLKSKNQMSLDLERLLNQKEELSVMKQVVLSLSTRKYGDGKTASRDLTKPQPAVYAPKNAFEPHDDPNVSKPGSISLTKQQTPQWYKKLKQKKI